MTLKEIAKDPLAQITAGLSGIVALLNPEVLLALFDALFASAPQLFSAISVGALTLPQVIPPESAGEWVVVVVGALFMLYLGREIWLNIDREV